MEDINIYHAELNLATYMGSTVHQNCPYSLHASDFGSQTSISPCEAPDLLLGALLFNDPHFASFINLLHPDLTVTPETAESRPGHPEDHLAYPL